MVNKSVFLVKGKIVDLMKDCDTWTKLYNARLACERMIAFDIDDCDEQKSVTTFLEGCLMLAFAKLDFDKGGAR